jgi:hypothetical protein
MRKQRASVAVFLSVGGATLDLAALEEVPRARVVRATLAAGERAVCVSATLEHECETRELAADLRVWAAARGWAVTVAPLGRPG